MINEILEAKKRWIEGLPNFHGLFKYSIRNFQQAIQRQDKISIIAEIKPTSPVLGVLQDKPNIGSIVNAYQKGGAKALSILTEEYYFGGTLKNISIARESSNLPILCKDFIISSKQLPWICAAGADACLLILSILEIESAKILKKEIEQLGMQAVVEIHTEKELESALQMDSKIILINQRNLQTMTIDPNTTANLINKINKNITVISASGFNNKTSILSLPKKVDAVLIGTFLMQQTDPEKILFEILS